MIARQRARRWPAWWLRISRIQLSDFPLLLRIWSRTITDFHIYSAYLLSCFLDQGPLYRMSQVALLLFVGIRNLNRKRPAPCHHATRLVPEEDRMTMTGSKSGKRQSNEKAHNLSSLGILNSHYL